MFGWSLEDLDALDAHLESIPTTRASLKEYQLEHLSSPPIPLLEDRKALLAYDCGAGDDDELRDVPQWVRTVCRSREHFAEVVLCFGDLPNAPLIALSHASQSPHWAHFVGLNFASAEGAPPGAYSVPGPMPRRDHFYNFRVDHTFFLDEYHPLLEGGPTVVIPYLVFEGNFLAWSDHRAIDYEEFVEGLPAVTAVSGKPPKRLDAGDDAWVTAHPWQRRLRRKTAASELGGLPEEGGVDDGAVVGVNIEELYAAMLESSTDFGVSADDIESAKFIVEPYSGHNSGKKPPKLDAFRAKPTGGLEQEWMNDHFPSGHRSITCSIGAYQARFAVGLCNLWAAIMRHWFLQFLASDDDSDVTYDVLDVPSLGPKALIDDLDALPAGDIAKKRFISICALYPVVR